MTLQAWLESERDYEQGVLLYTTLGENARLKLLFSGGASTYNSTALLWELQKLFKAGAGHSDTTRTSPRPLSGLVSNLPKKVQQEPAPHLDSVANATISLQKALTLDEKGTELLDQLAQARRPLYDERTLLHGQLELLAETKPQDEVRQMAARIMAISRELNANWKLDAYVHEHGQLPPPAPAAPGLDTLSPVELVKKRNALRSQVSKLKKRTDRADDLVQAQTDLSVVEALLSHE